MIHYQAPGKAVIWGEYAVLEGAPALVMAVDRYASTRVETAGDHWRCEAKGFAGVDEISAAELSTGTVDESRAMGVVAAAVKAVTAAIDAPNLPSGARVMTDTSAFYFQDTKLGIGSSAAICSSTYAAIAELLETPATYTGALNAHHHLQGSAGSGLDVAAAWHGGLIRFEKQTVVPTEWPEKLHYRFFWTGHSAKTTDHLQRFNRWKAAESVTPLDALCRSSARLFEEPSIGLLAEYVENLKAMDVIAGLGIYSDSHRVLDALANAAEVVYKPCGAGGGDIGIALSEEPETLQRFSAQASQKKYQALSLEIADHGIHRIGG